MEKPWIRNQRRVILANIRARFGDQWQTCLSAEVQKAVYEAEVLRLVMSQAMEKYRPAQEMAQAVLSMPDRSWPAFVPKT